jgi:signal transduction histidine kinase
VNGSRNERGPIEGPLRRSRSSTLLVVAALFAITWIIVTRPDAPVLADEGRLQVAISTFACVAMLVAAFVAHLRYAFGGSLRDLMQGLAFTLAAGSNLVAAVVWNSDSDALGCAWGAMQLASAVAFFAASRAEELSTVGRRQRLLWSVVAATGATGAATLLAATAPFGGGVRVTGAVLDVCAAAFFFAAAPLLWRPATPTVDRGTDLPMALVLCFIGFNALQYSVYPLMSLEIQAHDVIRGSIALTVLVMAASWLIRTAAKQDRARREMEVLEALSGPGSELGLAAVCTHIGRVVGALLDARVVVSLAGTTTQAQESPHLEAKDTGERIGGELPLPGTTTIGNVASGPAGGQVSIEVPLVSGLRRLGTLRASRPAASPFTTYETEQLRRCGAQATMLLDRSMLQEGIAASAVLEERSRLSREVHDGLAQHLAFLKMRIAWLRRSPDALETEQLEDVEKVLESALTDAREAISTLRVETHGPSTADAIAGYAAEFGHASGLSVQVVHDTTIPEIGPKARVELFRIVQEVLNNARKHAKATGVEVQVRTRGRGIEVTIHDDGEGFEGPAGNRGHFGLDIMRERAESIGGHCDVSSVLGSGTTVRVWVPALESSSAQLGDAGIAKG